MTNTSLFYVMGDPIEHSLSPLIHKLFAKQCGINLQYKTMRISCAELSSSLLELKSQNSHGASVTAPLKEKLFLQLDNISDRAKHAQAINTLSLLKGRSFFGDNTDGIGFVRDISHNNLVTINSKKILILGAGGAVRGLMRPLLSLSPQKIVICNRSQPKALCIAEYFKPWGKVRVVKYERLSHSKFDIIINATSAGLTGSLPPLPENFSVKNSECYDLSYKAAHKPFLKWAQKHQANKIIDGLGMLVEQAAEAFYLWHQVRPATELVIKEIRGAPTE